MLAAPLSPGNEPYQLRPMLTSSPSPVEEAAASELRGRIFTDLDRLAFALEMEAAHILDRGDEPAARRMQEIRLGVRLAQRLTAGVYAAEVDARIQRWSSEYEARFAEVPR
jgi:hypothetical protein